MQFELRSLSQLTSNSAGMILTQSNFIQFLILETFLERKTLQKCYLIETPSLKTCKNHSTLRQIPGELRWEFSFVPVVIKVPVVVVTAVVLRGLKTNGTKPDTRLNCRVQLGKSGNARKSNKKDESNRPTDEAGY